MDRAERDGRLGAHRRRRRSGTPIEENRGRRKESVTECDRTEKEGGDGDDDGYGAERKEAKKYGALTLRFLNIPHKTASFLIKHSSNVVIIESMKYGAKQQIEGDREGL
jgi:hypothetical protein